MRTTRLPLVIAWVLILGVIAYLGTHPRLIAPLLSHLVSRNLFGTGDGSLRVQDFRWRPFQGLDLFDVTVTIKQEGGGVTLVSADTLLLEYRLREVLSSPARLQRATLIGGELYSVGGSRPPGAERASLRWPRLRIAQMIIRDSALEFSGPDGRLLERIPEFSWRGVVRMDSVLSLDCRNADIHWETHSSRFRGMFGELTVSDAGIHCRDLHAQVNESRIVISGGRTWGGDIDLALSGTNVRAAEIEDLIDQNLGFAAEGDIAATFRTAADTLFYSGTFSGELQGYRMEEIFGRAAITPGSVHWWELNGRINGASFSGQGDFDVRDPEAVAFTLWGEVSGVDLAQDLVPGQDLPPTDGHGTLTITRRERPEYTHVTGVVRDGFIAEIPFDTCYVDVEAGADGVSFNNLDLRHRGLRAILKGRSDPDRYFRGRLQLDTQDLRRLPAAWNLPALAGSLVAAGRVEGLQEDLTFTGEARLRDLELSAVRADSTVADLVIVDVLGDPRASFGARGEGLSLSGIPLGAFRTSGVVSARLARVDSFVAQLGDTLLSFRGRAAFVPGQADFRLRSLQIDLEGNRWRLTEPAAFSVSPDGFSLPEIRLVSQQGSLALDVLYQRERIVAGNLQLRRFDLGLLNPFLREEIRLTGQVTADALLAGTPDRPLVSLAADVVACHLPQARIDTLHLAASFQEGTLQVRTLELISDQGRLRGSGTIVQPGTRLERFWPGAALDLELEISEGDWNFVDQFQLEALDRLAGRYQAKLAVRGTTSAPRISGEITSAPFNVHWLHLEELRGRLEVDSQHMVLADLQGRQAGLTATGRIEIPLTFDLLSTPDTPLDGPFLLHLIIPPQSDLGPLARATNAFIECGGRGGGEITAAGPLAHPLYTGSIAVRNGNFVLKRLGEIYREVSFDGQWQGDVLQLRNITGQEGARGTLRGNGTVTFAGLALETFDLRLAVDRFLVASIPDLRVLVRSQDVRLTGVKVGPDSLIVPKFAGDLEILQARFTGDFAEKPSVSDPRLATIAPDWLAEVHLVGPPRSARILNRAMELSMSGDVNLIRDVEGLYLRGAMDIDTGRLVVFNNDFKVLRGRLDFSQEVGLDPRVDMEAETSVRIRDADLGGSVLERITVFVTGTLYEPIIRFASESGYSREGIERMLLGLSPYAGDPRTSGGLRDASIAAGFNLLEREIAAGLNVVDTFDIEQIEREPTSGTSLAPLIGVGKYLGSDLYVKYAQGLSQADRDLLVEYQINDHLLLQSEIRRRIDELQGDTTYTLDLKYRFEY